jgi:hypothetical protein
MTTNMKINISDAWKDIDSIKINISDVWKDVVEAEINIGDSWKTVFTASGTLEVSGVSGTVDNGEIIIISGCNFGANGPTIEIFDDFEGGVAGNDISTGVGSAVIGEWDSLGANAPYYTNSTKNSGSLAFQAESGTTCVNSGYIHAKHNFDSGSSNEFFGCWWVYLPDADNWPGYGSEGGQGGPNWKQVWVHHDPGHMGNDVVLCTVFTGDGAICGNYAGGYVKYVCGMTKGTWRRVWVYWVGSPSGEGTCIKKYMIKGSTITNCISETGITNQSNADEPYTFLKLGSYCHVSIGCCSHPTFDDFYFAVGPNCRARVEIGTHATYGDCTNLTICTVDSWSATSITATVRQGSFASEENAYLFVIDANGNVSDGYAIQFA